MCAGYISARRGRDRIELVWDRYWALELEKKSRRRREVNGKGAGATQSFTVSGSTDAAGTAVRPGGLGATQPSSVRDSVEAAGIAVLPGGRETRGDAVVYGRWLDGGR